MSNLNSKKFDTKSEETRLHVAAHRVSDVDVDEQSLHHTLGRGPFQAARGTHTHSYTNGERPYTLDQLFDRYLKDSGDVDMTSWFATGYRAINVSNTCYIRKIGQDVTVVGAVAPNAGNFASGVTVNVMDKVPDEWLGLPNISVINPISTTTGYAKIIRYGLSDANKGLISVVPSAITPFIFFNMSWRLSG